MPTFEIDSQEFSDAVADCIDVDNIAREVADNLDYADIAAGASEHLDITEAVEEALDDQGVLTEHDFDAQAFEDRLTAVENGSDVASDEAVALLAERVAAIEGTLSRVRSALVAR